MVASYRSEPLHKAVVAQRNIKSAEEVAEIERAIGVSREMYLAAMAAAKPGQVRIRSGGRDHPRRESERLRPLVPDHLLGARRDAPQPPSREPDEEGRRDGARLGRRDPEQVRERHHPHDSGRRDVHGAAAADLRDGAAGAARGHQGHQAWRAVQGRPPAGRAQHRDGPQGRGSHEGRCRRGGRGRRARAVLPARPRPHDRPRRPRPREHGRAVRRLRARRRARASSSASATCASRARSSPGSC